MYNQHLLPDGFSERPASMADLDAATELFNICSQAQIGNNESTRANVANGWNTPGFNQETDQRVILSPDGGLVGYTEVWTLNPTPVHPNVWGRVHPDYEGLGIGSYLMQWAEQRSLQVLEKVPPQARVSFRAHCWDSYAPAKDLLEGFGMDLIRHGYQMRIQLSDPPSVGEEPEGIQIRTFRPEDAEAVYQADDEAFQDHFGYAPMGFDRFKYHFINDPGFDPDLWFLAVYGDEVAGVCLCRKESREDNTMGWVTSLGVRREWRRRGIGLALLRHSFAAYWQRGKIQVGLGVDAQNLTGALRLYQKAGMHVHRKSNMYEKELRAGTELTTTDLDNQH